MAKKSWHQYSNPAPKHARTGHDGFAYDSKTEMDRFYYLQILAKAGEISDLQRQVSYELFAYQTTDQAGYSTKHKPIMVGKKRNKVAVYTPDFVYKNAAGETVVEDVKGFSDEASKFRIRVFESFYGQHVTIVKKVRGAGWVCE